MKVQKEYEYGRDIGECIRDMVVIDLSVLRPQIQELKETDPAKRAREEKALDIVYQSQMELYLKREAILEENLGKAYSLIYENYCDHIMQTRIKEHPKYLSEILNDPIKLLEEIAKLMHEPIRAQFPYLSMMEAHRRLLNMKQREKENLLDYLERFKQEKSIVKSHLGDEFLDTFVEHTEEYKDLIINQQPGEAAILKTKAFKMQQLKSCAV